MLRVSVNYVPLSVQRINIAEEVDAEEGGIDRWMYIQIVVMSEL